MKSTAVVSLFLAASLATTGFAFAQGRGDRNDDRVRDGQEERGAGPDHAAIATGIIAQLLLSR